MSSHIVLFPRIGEEVGLCAGLDTGIKKRETVLGYDCVVMIASDNLQTTIQIASLVEK
jgi:hypothetical protein